MQWQQHLHLLLLFPKFQPIIPSRRLFHRISTSDPVVRRFDISVFSPFRMALCSGIAVESAALPSFTFSGSTIITVLPTRYFSSDCDAHSAWVQVRHWWGVDEMHGRMRRDTIFCASYRIRACKWVYIMKLNRIEMCSCCSLFSFSLLQFNSQLHI